LAGRIRQILAVLPDLKGAIVVSYENGKRRMSAKARYPVAKRTLYWWIHVYTFRRIYGLEEDLSRDYNMARYLKY